MLFLLWSCTLAVNSRVVIRSLLLLNRNIGLASSYAAG